MYYSNRPRYRRQEPACPGGEIYEIKAGDTLYKLAQMFRVGVNEILAANPGLNPNALMIGQKICIPQSDLPECLNGFIYTIKPGDNLYQIGQKYGLTVDEMIDANPQLESPADLEVGMNICVPTGGKGGEGCLVLRPTAIDISEGVVYINYEDDIIMVTATELPPMGPMNADNYVAYLKLRDSNNYRRFVLETVPEMFIETGRVKLDRPIEDFEEIMISAEQNSGGSQPAMVVMRARFDDACRT